MTFLSQWPHNVILKSLQARPMQNAIIINDKKQQTYIALCFCWAQSTVSKQQLIGVVPMLQCSNIVQLFIRMHLLLLQMN